MATSFGISPESMSALRGVRITRLGTSTTSAIANFSNDGTVDLMHSHSFIDNSTIKIREVALKLDLQAGVLTGTEYLSARALRHPIVIPETNVQGADCEARLPVSGVKIGDYLRSMLVWLTGANGSSWNRDRFIDSVQNREVTVVGSTNAASVFDGLKEIEQNIWNPTK